jgi:hypothetical protein
MIDHEATRAAARALYEGQSRYHFTDLSDAALTAMIRDAHERPHRHLIVSKTNADAILVAPPTMPPPTLDAGEIETVLRSVPQICHHCRLPSNAEPTVCPSPRGHWFVTDYTAMAEKLRERLR